MSHAPEITEATAKHSGDLSSNGLITLSNEATEGASIHAQSRSSRAIPRIAHHAHRPTLFAESESARSLV